MKSNLESHFVKTAITFLLVIQSIFSINATATEPIDTLDILSKIDYIIDNSNKYKEFKVVKKTWLYDLKSQISDSLRNTSIESSKTIHQIGVQRKEIETLKQTISETNSILSNANSEKDKISLLGISLQKGTYNGIMFSTIIMLFILLLIFVIRFRASNKMTLETKTSYNSLDNEFELYKKNALDKEQKLKRQLQDEINKNNRLTKN